MACENYFSGLPLIISPEINLDPGWLSQEMGNLAGYDYPLLIIDDIDVLFEVRKSLFGSKQSVYLDINAATLRDK